MRLLTLAEFEARRRGFSQYELASRLQQLRRFRNSGVSQQRVSEVYRGLRHAPTLLAMAELFGYAASEAHRLVEPVADALNPEAQAARLAAKFAEAGEQ